jgi:hypothetical protein
LFTIIGCAFESFNTVVYIEDPPGQQVHAHNFFLSSPNHHVKLKCGASTDFCNMHVYNYMLELWKNKLPASFAKTL